MVEQEPDKFSGHIFYGFWQFASVVNFMCVIICFDWYTMVGTYTCNNQQGTLMILVGLVWPCIHI